MTNLNELLAQSIPATLPQTLDTYENPADGLLYCSCCHTPKQAKNSFPGKEMVVNVLCHCQKQRRDQEIAARKRREMMDFVTGMRANSLQNANLKEYTFANDLGYTPELALAKRYVEQWDSMKAQKYRAAPMGRRWNRKILLCGLHRQRIAGPRRTGADDEFCEDSGYRHRNVRHGAAALPFQLEYILPADSG